MDRVRFTCHLEERILSRYPVLAHFAHRVGGTHLMEVPTPLGSARLFAKCEGENPSGSVKDRVSFAMLYCLLASREGCDLARLHLLEYSGGTLANSLAQLCQQMGIRLTLVLSSSTSVAQLRALQVSGVQIELVERERGFYAVIERALELKRENPELKFLYQHQNAANLWVHRNTTGREMAIQVQRRLGSKPTIHAWIASIGTGGTLMGVYDALSALHPHLRLFAVTPSELPYGSQAPPNGLSKFLGSGGFGLGRKQPFVEERETKIERHFTVSYAQTLRQIIAFEQEAGIKLGSSSAANLIAAKQVAADLGTGKTVVTVFPSFCTAEEWELAVRERARAA